MYPGGFGGPAPRVTKGVPKKEEKEKEKRKQRERKGKKGKKETKREKIDMNQHDKRGALFFVEIGRLGLWGHLRQKECTNCVN